MKLSKSQIDALEQAAYKDTHDQYLFSRGLSVERGWFMPQHHDCAAVGIRWQTAASLCGRGLLEYRTLDYVQTGGKWRAVNEYHITEAGKAWLAQERAVEGGES